MSRKVWLWICAGTGLALLGAGLILPAYLRAVDAEVLRQAGWGTPGLVDLGLSLAAEKNPGAAQLVFEAARQQNLPGQEKLGAALDALKRQAGSWQVLGERDRRLEPLFPTLAVATPSTNGPPLVTEFFIRRANREKALEFLVSSPQPTVRELLRLRAATNTVLFTPSASSSGQAIDTAICLCGLLLESGRLSPSMSAAIESSAKLANQGASSEPLEDVLMQLLSLGQRFNWGQFTRFIAPIQNVETLRLLANLARSDESRVPVLFSAAQLSGQPAGVGRYLVTYSQSGWLDLAASFRFGAGGVQELLARNQRLYVSRHESQLGHTQSDGTPLNRAFGWGANLSWRLPGFALTVKWILYLCGGFLLAAAAHFAWPAVPALERPLQVRGVHVAREVLFALGFLLVVLLLSEPFLAQESQKVEFPFRSRLSMMGGAILAGAPAVKSTFMNPKSLLTLLLFFVLQGLLYTACVVKLAEIRRQRVPARIKLKLLENEDHLFDGGLYLGFVGTIISLILVSLGVIQPSLMAAYSSTSFGIIFVSIFKIFHLRPARRTLLLEAEAATPEFAAPAAGPALAKTS